MIFSQVPSLIEPLREQISKVRLSVERSFGDELHGALLVGSCARGEATHRSDIDLLIFVKEGPLTFERTRSLRDRLDSALSGLGAFDAPLPVQAFFLVAEAWSTADPGMGQSLEEAIILLDPKKFLETRWRRRFSPKEPRRYDE